ncbi:MAG TPA: ribosome biogenesis GTPase YlqF [Desulfuromonadales bacterium]|jgi:ribosome biogenesis GTPase A
MKIEWFPGHMNKASRQIAETIQGFDVIIEVLDARLPVSSANPLLEELRRGKPCIKVLNKNDLADPVVTKAWVRHFEKEAGVRALPLEARKRLEVGHLPQLCRRLAPHRGQPGKPLRAMVIGIPNVGKSTLINTLAGKAMARVGDRPAITTCPQQIDLRNGIRLSDTPGLLWPVMSDQNGAYRLAASGAIGESAMDYVQVALFTAAFMLHRYPELLAGRYKLALLPEEPSLLLEEIGRRRGCLVSGGEVDLHRAAELFLRELRGGKLGRISLEEPGQENGEEAAAEENVDAPEGI